VRVEATAFSSGIPPGGDAAGLGGSSPGSLRGSLHHPSIGRTVRYEAREIPDYGDEQVAAVIRFMREYVAKDADSPEIQALAQRLVADCQSEREALCRVWQHVHDKIRFDRDENIGQPVQPLLPDRYKDKGEIVEVLIRPLDMATMCEGVPGCTLVGDCDDYVMYVLALLSALGIKAKLVTVAANDRDPGQFSHVYVAAYLKDGSRVALDASHGEYCGWEVAPGHCYRKEEWELRPGLKGLLVIGLAVALALCWLRTADRTEERAA
jgi:transglutaminase-like putative cysteine protease